MRRMRWIGGVLVLMAATGGLRAEDAPDMQQLMEAMTAMMSGGASNEAAAVVNFRELKALLPNELPGMKRTKAEGAKNRAMGMTVVTAEAEYQGEDGGEIGITLSDLGGLSGLGAMAQAGWAMAEIDRETETGFERTSQINGHKAMESYDTQDREGGIRLMVADRFTVEIEGRGVPFETIRSVLDRLDLDRLAQLKPES